MCNFHEFPGPVQFIYKIASGFYPGNPFQETTPHEENHEEHEEHEDQEFKVGQRLKEYFQHLGYSDNEIRQFFEMAKKITPEDVLGDLSPKCH